LFVDRKSVGVIEEKREDEGPHNGSRGDVAVSGAFGKKPPAEIGPVLAVVHPQQLACGEG
jgi:hypothetical protein